jgi:hypothetical protein
VTSQESNAHHLTDAEVLVVSGRPFAFGLRWTSAGSRSTLTQEAQAAATAEGANYVAIHAAYNQFGLARLPSGGNVLQDWLFRPRSGAAAIAMAVGAAALAAFPLDDGRWIVLAFDRKGILPDGDLILGNETAARERIAGLNAQSPAVWRKRFVPEQWGFPDSKGVHAADLLQGHWAPRLKALTLLINRDRLRLAAMVSAAALGVGGFACLERLAAPPPAPVAYAPLPKPVAAKWAPATLSIDQCLLELGDAERLRAVAGWLPSKFTCQPGKSLFIDFTRTGIGQISAMVDLLPSAQLSEDGRSATLSLPLDPLPQISSIGPFDPEARYRVIGLDLGQRLNGAFSFQSARKPLPGENDPISSTPWMQFTWSYRTGAPPAVWASALSHFGSIDIESLVHAPNDNLWLVSGSLYARP